MDTLERDVGDESMEDVFLREDLSPTIAEHAKKCQSLFHKYMAVPEIVPDTTIVDDQRARFSMWISKMDVYGPLNISLDYRLRFSPMAVDLTHQLLDVICDTLLSLKPIDGRIPQHSSRNRQSVSVNDNGSGSMEADGESSDSESDVDPAEGNFVKITETIAGTVARLFRLSSATRKSAKANRTRTIERYRDDEETNKMVDEVHLYTKWFMNSRFPKAPEMLRSALVEANAFRLRRLLYQHSHRRRIDLSIQSSERSVTGVPEAKSVLANNTLSFPPIPSTPQCTYCGVIVDFKSIGKSLLWQNHVITDLEPYICFFPQCLEDSHGRGTGPPTFATSTAWIGHIQDTHEHAWVCGAPSHDLIVFDKVIDHQEHLIQAHSVPKAHVNNLSDLAQRSFLTKIMECPFGDEFKSSDGIGSSMVFASDALQSHVAAHMIEIALLKLQKLPT